MRVKMYYRRVRGKPYLVRLWLLNGVWKAVVKEPQVPIRVLADRLGVSSSKIWAALHLLKDMGYIDFVRGATQTRTIKPPKYEVKKDYLNETFLA